MGKYNSEFDINNMQDSHSLVLKCVKPNTTILEFGCANGNMTQYMTEKLGCNVYIVEYNSEDFLLAMKYAKDGVCGDILELEWIERFQDLSFDTIIFADVLEHLTDPEKALKCAMTLLKECGEVITSIPNIAHNAVIIDLLQNKFEYHTTGLLDNTHIHLFTYYSFLELLDTCALTPIELYDTTCEPIHTEFHNYYNDIDGIMDVVKGKEFGLSYQFIMKSVKSDFYKNNIGEIQISNAIQRNTFGDMVLYLNTGDGFSQDEIFEIPMTKNRTDQHYVANIVVPASTKSLRLDPIENQFCILKNLKIYGDGVLLPYNNLNGFTTGNIEIFLNFDPQISVSITGQRHIRIQLERYIFDFNHEILCELLHLLPNQQNQISQLIEENHNIVTRQKLQMEHLNETTISTINQLCITHEQELSASKQTIDQWIMNYNELQLLQTNTHHDLTMSQEELSASKQTIDQWIMNYNELQLLQTNTYHDLTTLQEDLSAYVNRYHDVVTQHNTVSEKLCQTQEALDSYVIQHSTVTDKNKIFKTALQKIELLHLDILNQNRYLEERLEEIQLIHQQTVAQNQLLKEQLEYAQMSYQAISNSFFWKITKPFRHFLAVIKKIGRDS